MKNLMYLLLFACGGLSLAACNTTRGFGEDVEAAGEAIEDTAEDTEEEIEEMRD